MTHAPKVAGQPCNDGCGGKYVTNPKTGKTFCENKCWLTPDQKAQSNNPDQPNWDEIAKGKVRHGLVCAMIGAGWDSTQIRTQLLMYENLVMGKISNELPVQQVEESPAADPNMPPF